jgi:hypothetical protein
MLSTSTCKAQMIAVNTDVLNDVAMVPNIGFELATGNSTTLTLQGAYATRALGKEIRIAALQPELRYYLSRRTMHNEFVGIGAIGASYKINWKNKIYDGDALGIGLTFGYVWNLSQRFSVDFHAGLGVVTYKHKEYYDGDDYQNYSESGKTLTNAKGYYLIPTRIGISLSYILK